MSSKLLSVLEDLVYFAEDATSVQDRRRLDLLLRSTDTVVVTDESTKGAAEELLSVYMDSSSNMWLPRG